MTYCENCKYFHRVFGGQGECRIQPPQLVTRGWQQSWEFPTVSLTTYCGQHSPKRATYETKDNLDEEAVKQQEPKANPYGEYELRNQKIFEELEGGVSLTDIATKYGISKPRIHQIVSKIRRKKAFEELRKKREEQPVGDGILYTASNINKDGYDRLMMRVKDCEFSTRLATCLLNSNIEFVWQIFTHSDKELLREPNFGKKTLNEMKEVLAAWKYKRSDKLSANLKWCLEHRVPYFDLGKVEPHYGY